MVKTGFTEPKLHDYDGDLKKDWYVQFRYTHPVTGLRKPFQFRMNINVEPSKSARYVEARRVIVLLSSMLKDGWDPFNENYRTFLTSRCSRDAASVEQKKKGNAVSSNPSLTALALAIEEAAARKKKSLAPKSYGTYRTVKNYALAAIKHLGFDNMPVCEVRRSHIIRVLDRMQDDRQAAYDADGAGKIFTGNNYNKYREFLHGLFAEIEQACDLDFNPCHKRASKQEIKMKPHRHATPQEEKAIKQMLRANHPRLYIFLAVEELSELRPNEILSLRIRDIDWFNQWFKIGADQAKTRTARNTTIPNALLPMLKQLELEQYPKDWYVFSRGTQLSPGPCRIARDKVTKTWKKLVKDELGIDVSLYSFKGLGGDKKIAAGIDKGAVSAQMGHTSIAMTDRYLEREEERKRRVIAELTPEFELDCELPKFF